MSDSKVRDVSFEGHRPPPQAAAIEQRIRSLGERIPGVGVSYDVVFIWSNEIADGTWFWAVDLRPRYGCAQQPPETGQDLADQVKGLFDRELRVANAMPQD